MKSIFLSHHWIRTGVLLIILIIMLALAQKYFIGLFFYPDREDYGNPAYQRLDHDAVEFPSRTGERLYGYFLKPKGAPKGTVVQCHGNAQNASSHYKIMLFLVEAGYNVFSFDYNGYGQSEGKPSPEGIIHNTLDALAYVRTRPDIDVNRIALFGQSLGGAAAAAAMAEDGAVRCLVLEGTFTTYREMAWASIIGKLLFFITPFAIPDTGPIDHLKKIAPRPILFVHGEDDRLIPHRFARKLYENASHKKVLSVINNFRHLHGDEALAEYQKVVLDFLTTHLAQ